MRYAIHLVPDALLLVVLLRMTFVGLIFERRAMFIFLSAWLIYSLALLFLAQIISADSPTYVSTIAISSVAVWIISLPAMLQVTRALNRSFFQSICALAIIVVAYASIRLIRANPGFDDLAKFLAINCWISAVYGAMFLFASVHAENPDRVLWRGCGAFFLLYGFGYLLIGIYRPGGWAYPALVLSAGLVWLAMAWYIGPHPDHLFNLEKLALVPAAFRIPAVLRRNHG